jgi:hypothetical protein
VAQKLPEQLLGSYSGARGLWLGQGAVLEQLGQACVVEGLLQHIMAVDAASAAAAGSRSNGAAVTAAGVGAAGVLLPWVAAFQHQMVPTGVNGTTTGNTSSSSTCSEAAFTIGGQLWQQVLTAAGDVPDTGPLQLPQLLQVLQLLQAECHPVRSSPARSTATRTTAAAAVSSRDGMQQQEACLLVLSAITAHRGGCGEAAQALLQVAMAAACDAEHKGWLKVSLPGSP